MEFEALLDLGNPHISRIVRAYREIREVYDRLLPHRSPDTPAPESLTTTSVPFKMDTSLFSSTRLSTFGNL